MEFFRLAVLSLTTIGLGSGFVAVGSAHAAPTAGKDVALTNAQMLAVVSAGLGARDRAIGDVAAPDVRRVAQSALNALVHDGVVALREHGDGSMAASFEQSWNGSYANALVGMSALDLGDHPPLSHWLANFYNKLELRLGSSLIHQGLLGDVYDMNYALPVVFAPRGAWRATVAADRDWVEYRKHFIPFADVVTYYGVSIACNAIAAKQGLGKQGKQLCGKVAVKLRELMGRYVAPKVSDFVYNKANGISTKLVITRSDLVYTDAQTLVTEIASEPSSLN